MKISYCFFIVIFIMSGCATRYPMDDGKAWVPPHVKPDDKIDILLTDGTKIERMGKDIFFDFTPGIGYCSGGVNPARGADIVYPSNCKFIEQEKIAVISVTDSSSWSESKSKMQQAFRFIFAPVFVPVEFLFRVVGCVLTAGYTCKYGLYL